MLPNTVLKGVALEGEKVKLTTQDDREVSARGRDVMEGGGGKGCDGRGRREGM